MIAMYKLPVARFSIVCLDTWRAAGTFNTDRLRLPELMSLDVGRVMYPLLQTV